MIGSSQNLKVRDILCALRFVCEVNVSISHGRRDACGMSAGSGLPLSVTLTGVWGGVDITLASIKRNLNIL